MGALSVLLIAAGAILTFAVKTVSNDVDLTTVGVILMVVGGIGLIASIMRGTMMGFSSTRETRVIDGGQTVVEHERSGGF
ncbi:MAG: hypothetical protein JWN99_206 [Ilumatobacteraceae bacterium]|nr:hypothetical protein [Ilumatobacteraceae bacterium]